jgi:hypothetical protein
MFSLTRSTFSSLRQGQCRHLSQSLTASKYPFLARLGIKEHNEGCWDGKQWRSGGVSHTAVNPSTGEAIATVNFGSAEDYEVSE